MKYLNIIYLILGMVLSSAIHSIDITNKMKSHISSYPWLLKDLLPWL